MSTRKLAAQFRDGSGNLDYTAAGRADADLTSAGMALEQVLNRSDLTPTQRLDLNAALRATRKAWGQVARHVDADKVVVVEEGA